MLFGATGDLAARKLLPGLLHLSQSGMLPDFRIVGTSLSELTDEEFRHVARHACDQFATGKISLLEWAGFEQKLSFVSQSTGPAGLAAAVTVAENSLGGDDAPPPLLEHPARCGRRRRPDVARGRPGRTVERHHGETVRDRSGQRQGVERHRARDLP